MSSLGFSLAEHVLPRLLSWGPVSLQKWNCNSCKQPVHLPASETWAERRNTHTTTTPPPRWPDLGGWGHSQLVSYSQTLLSPRICKAAKFTYVWGFVPLEFVSDQCLPQQLASSHIGGFPIGMRLAVSEKGEANNACMTPAENEAISRKEGMTRQDGFSRRPVEQLPNLSYKSWQWAFFWSQGLTFSFPYLNLTTWSCEALRGQVPREIDISAPWTVSLVIQNSRGSFWVTAKGFPVTDKTGSM